MPEMKQAAYRLELDLLRRLADTPRAWSSVDALQAVVLDCYQEAGERLRQPDLADEQLAASVARELRAEYVAAGEPPVTAELVRGLMLAPMLRLRGPSLGPESEAALARLLDVPRSTLQRWRAAHSDEAVSLSDSAFLDAMALKAQERHTRRRRRTHLREQGRSAVAAYWWELRHRGEDAATAPPPRRTHTRTHKYPHNGGQPRTVEDTK